MRYIHYNSSFTVEYFGLREIVPSYSKLILEIISHVLDISLDFCEIQLLTSDSKFCINLPEHSNLCMLRSLGKQ